MIPESQSADSETSKPPKQYNRLRKSKEQVDKAAKLIAGGMKIKPALMASGWSEQGANRGKAALTGPILNAIAKQGVHLKDLGRQALASPEEMHQIAVGRVMFSTITGDEKGLQAAKQLGSHKAVNCWQQDVSAGLIVIQMQGEMNQATDKPVIDLPMVEE